MVIPLEVTERFEESEGEADNEEESEPHQEPNHTYP